MCSVKPNSFLPRLLSRLLPIPVAFAALSTLASCGGGGDAPAASVASPQPSQPSQPDPPATPTTPTNPPPVVDPAPTPPADEVTVTLATTLTELGVADSTSQPNWPVWTGTGQPVSGVGCLRNEDYHIHTLLSIYRNGTRLALPDAIGRSGCTYELHTHDATGVIHIETDMPKTFTLGQFFALWRQPLSASGIAGLEGPYRTYLIENGTLTRYTGDPAALQLTARREIVILTGPNPPTVLPKYNWPPAL